MPIPVRALASTLLLLLLRVLMQILLLLLLLLPPPLLLLEATCIFSACNQACLCPRCAALGRGLLGSRFLCACCEASGVAGLLHFRDSYFGRLRADYGFVPRAIAAEEPQKREGTRTVVAQNRPPPI